MTYKFVNMLKTAKLWTIYLDTNEANNDDKKIFKQSLKTIIEDFINKGN